LNSVPIARGAREEIHTFLAFGGGNLYQMLSQVEYEYLFYRTSNFHVKLKNTMDRNFGAMIFSPEFFRNGTWKIILYTFQT
jgi:hypothetical protein